MRYAHKKYMYVSTVLYDLDFVFVSTIQYYTYMQGSSTDFTVQQTSSSAKTQSVGMVIDGLAGYSASSSTTVQQVVIPLH